MVLTRQEDKQRLSKLIRAQREVERRRRIRLDKEAKAAYQRERNRKNQANSRARKKNMSSDNTNTNEADNALDAEFQALLNAKAKAKEEDEKHNAAYDADWHEFVAKRREQQEKARQEKFAPMDRRMEAKTAKIRAEAQKIEVENEMRRAKSARKDKESAAKVAFLQARTTALKLRRNELAETQQQPFVGIPLNDDELVSPKAAKEVSDSPDTANADSPDSRETEDSPDTTKGSPTSEKNGDIGETLVSPVVHIPMPRLGEPTPKTPKSSFLGRIFGLSGSKNPVDKEETADSIKVKPPGSNVTSPEPPVTTNPVVHNQRKKKVAFRDPIRLGNNMIIYNQAVLDQWSEYSDEEIVNDKFTKAWLEALHGEGPDGYLKVRQVLYVVKEKNLLRSLNKAPLKYANEVAFPDDGKWKWGKHFTTLSPVRRQIARRLDQDLARRIQLFREDEASNQAANQDDSSSSFSNDDEMEA